MSTWLWKAEVPHLPPWAEGWRRQNRRHKPCRPTSGGTWWFQGLSQNSAPCLSESHQTSPAINKGHALPSVFSMKTNKNTMSFRHWSFIKCLDRMCTHCLIMIAFNLLCQSLRDSAWLYQQYQLQSLLCIIVLPVSKCRATNHKSVGTSLSPWQPARTPATNINTQFRLDRL